MQNQNKVTRTVFRADNNNLYKFAALLNSGGVNKPWPNTATQFLKTVLFAQKGNERRELTDKEVTDLMARGYTLTNK